MASHVAADVALGQEANLEVGTEHVPGEHVAGDTTGEGDVLRGGGTVGEAWDSAGELRGATAPQDASFL